MKHSATRFHASRAWHAWCISRAWIWPFLYQAAGVVMALVMTFLPLAKETLPSFQADGVNCNTTPEVSDLTPLPTPLTAPSPTEVTAQINEVARPTPAKGATF